MTGNRHNIFVVKSGDNQGQLVRQDQPVIDDLLFVTTVEEHRVLVEPEGNLHLVGCVTDGLWHCTSGPEYDLGVLAREGVRRTAADALATV